MHRVVPDIGAIDLPSSISRGERSQFAAGLDELVELMTSILTLAAMRKTGRLPSLRIASNATTTAICIWPDAWVALPPQLAFEGRFVRRMLVVWDEHAVREPEDASTYLHVASREYVVGIASRDLVDLVADDDESAVARAVAGGARVTAVLHGGP